MKMLTQIGVAAGCLSGVAVLVGEFEHWYASYHDLGTPDLRTARTEAILVLGYPPTKRGGLHPVQKWRTLIAIRSMTPGLESVLIFSGGARDGLPSEAAVMAGYAERLGVPRSAIRLEEQAQTTWENVANSLSWLEQANVIKVASNSLHGRRARLYLREQRPDLAERLAQAADYRPGEWWMLKPLLMAYEWIALRRGQRGVDGHGPADKLIERRRRRSSAVSEQAATDDPTG